MKLMQIERRVKVLEQRVARLAQSAPTAGRRWYRTHAGRFARDPVFDEIVRLGQAYRKSQRPAPKPGRS